MDLIVFAVAALATVTVDQAVKHAVRIRLASNGRSWTPGEGPPVGIAPVSNPRGGLAELSPLAGGIGLLALSALLVFLITTMDEAGPLSVGLGLAWGGALSNWLDAVRQGYVLDYVRFRSGFTANLADLAIALGTIVAVVAFLVTAS